MAFAGALVKGDPRQWHNVQNAAVRARIILKAYFKLASKHSSLSESDVLHHSHMQDSATVLSVRLSALAVLQASVPAGAVGGTQSRMEGCCVSAKRLIQ